MHQLTSRFIATASLAWLSLYSLPTTAADTGSTTRSCSVQTDPSGTLARARSLFFSQCDHSALTDCDPVPGGGWQCSSAVIGNYSPAGQSASPPSSIVQPAPVIIENVSAQPSVAIEPIAGEKNIEACYARAGTLASAKSAFASSCRTFTRQDCDPIDGAWICGSANITAASRFTGDSVATANVAPAPAPTPGSVTENKPPENTNPPPAPVQPSTVNAASVGRLGSNDLLALHYDNCPDKDDGHAIPAGKAVVEKLGINNVLVANGTCGNVIRDRFNSASFAVVKASWGSDYLDAFNQRGSAVSAAANRWASVLANGGSVWVAEGGQSDFTADIVRRIETQYPNLNRKRIHVIQHSAGSTAYNEKFTASGNLSYLKSTTSYQAIPNGNVGGNGTADLNMQSDYFVRTARGGRFAAEWNAGFAYLKPDCATRTENCKLDFSDTVELLYIIDDQRTRSVDDFANNYLK